MAVNANLMNSIVNIIVFLVALLETFSSGINRSMSALMLVVIQKVRTTERVTIPSVEKCSYIHHGNLGMITVSCSSLIHCTHMLSGL